MNNMTLNSAGAILVNINSIATVENTQFTFNSAGSGGSIAVFGILSISDSSISDSTASNDGGGIYNEGNTTINTTTIDNNDASNLGGGIFNNGMLTITHSTISNNSSNNNAGGISNNGGSLIITNSTVSGNTAVNDGGGLRNDKGMKLEMNNVTIANNNAMNDGGGIWNESLNDPPSMDELSITNTLIADNVANAFGFGNDCFSDTIIPTGDDNLIEDQDDCTLDGMPISGAPQLGSLALNDNPNGTFTHGIQCWKQ